VLRDRNGRLPKVTARNLSVDAAPRFLIRNKLIDAGDFIGDLRARGMPRNAKPKNSAAGRWRTAKNSVDTLSAP
jgi:hypothetical protein